MKKSVYKIFIALLSIFLLFTFAACDGTESDRSKEIYPSQPGKDDPLSYYLDSFVNDEFIEHWVSYGLNAMEENRGRTCQVTLVAGDTDGDMEAEGRLIYAGVASWGPNEENENYNWVSLFESEEAAENYIQSDETISGGRSHIKRDGKAVYEETIEGFIENNIKNAAVTISPTYKNKIDFVKNALKEIKDPKSLVFVMIGGYSDSIMIDLLATHKNSNLTSTYAIYPKEEGYSDQDVLRNKYETGQWYTADSYISDTIEEGYTYYKVIDKPGFKYEFIKDENGDPTDKISVYAYLYDDASGVNMVIPSEIDGYTVERVSTYFKVKHPDGYSILDNLIDDSIKSIKFPRTMKEFTTYPVGTMDSLTKIEIEDGNPYFTVEDNCLISKEDNCILLRAKGAGVSD